MKTKNILIGVITLITIFSLLSMANANTYTYYTIPGATLNGLPVSAEAIFTTGMDSLAVELINLLADPKSVIQCLSDISFSLSSGNLLLASLTSSSGLERTVNADKTYADGSQVSTGWALNISGNTLELTVLGTPTAPTHTIIGPLNSSTNKYDNANPSITNSPHNPHLFGIEADPVIFTLLIPGVTGDTTISNILFSFGTSPGSNVPVPEPATMILLGSGLVGVGAFSRRRFKK